MQVDSIASQLAPVFVSTNLTHDQTQEVIAMATSLGMENRVRANQLLSMATQIASDNAQIQNVRQC